MRFSRVFSLFFPIGLALSAGCEPLSKHADTDNELLTQRAQLTLAEEPANPVGILELRETLKESDGVQLSESELMPAQPVVLVGRIGGKSTSTDRLASDFPWERGKAAFIMSDPSASVQHDTDHGEDHRDCPFCNKQAKDAQATVQFNGDNGDLLPMDARDLFELVGEELVVVKGKAQLVGTLLMINADGIYVRR